MSIDELESKALKLDPKGRARLAGKLLESLENLSAEENEQLWLEEAQRRDAELDETPGNDQPGETVLREAREGLS